MNKMYLVLGDWSDDGHGKYEKILLESNLSVKEIQDAYKKSCRLTEVSFSDNDGLDDEKYKIACEYEDNILTDFVFDILSKHGLTKKMLKKWSGEDWIETENIYLYQNLYTKLWIWFVKLSLLDSDVLKIVEGKEDIPVINGFWNKNLNTHFGYGLYH